MPGEATGAVFVEIDEAALRKLTQHGQIKVQYENGQRVVIQLVEYAEPDDTEGELKGVA